MAKINENQGLNDVSQLFMETVMDEYFKYSNKGRVMFMVTADEGEWKCAVLGNHGDLINTIINACLGQPAVMAIISEAAMRAMLEQIKGDVDRREEDDYEDDED